MRSEYRFQFNEGQPVRKADHPSKAATDEEDAARMQGGGEIYNVHFAVNKKYIRPAMQIKMDPAAIMNFLHNPFELADDARPDVILFNVTEVFSLQILQRKREWRQSFELRWQAVNSSKRRIGAGFSAYDDPAYDVTLPEPLLRIILYDKTPGSGPRNKHIGLVQSAFDEDHFAVRSGVFICKISLHPGQAQ